MKTILLTFSLFIASSSYAQGQSPFQVLNHQVQQGDVLVIQISPQWMPPITSGPAISVFGKQYFPNKQGQVFIGIEIDAPHGKYIAMFFQNGFRSGWDYEEIEVTQNNFPTRKRVPFIPSKKWEQEREAIKTAFDGGDYFERYFDEEFIKPLEEIVIDQNRTIGGVSSSFGDGHAGVDLITLDPNTGRHQREVRAINSGEVALIAKNFSTDGNMVILDHGSGIFSVYMHLSKFLVKKVGDRIKSGETIAISGRTGNAARGGPHLHFAVKIRSKDGTSDVYVDPLKFIDIMNQY